MIVPIYTLALTSPVSQTSPVSPQSQASQTCSDADCRSPIRRPFDRSRLHAIFRKCRFVVLHDVFNGTALATYRRSLETYVEGLPKDEWGELLTHQGRSTNGEAFSVHTLHPGRWEVLLPRVPFAQRQLLMQDDVLHVLRSALGREMVLHSLGTAIAAPGAGAQSWHTDAGALFEDVGEPEAEGVAEAAYRLDSLAGHALPSFAVTMLVPLKDMALSDGPTELCVGSSHLLGSLALQRGGANSSSDGSGGESGSEWLGRGPLACPTRCIYAPVPKLGDVVLFDYTLVRVFDTLLAALQHPHNAHAHAHPHPHPDAPRRRQSEPTPTRPPLLHLLSSVVQGPQLRRGSRR